jgi:hypothetical protein
MAAIRMMVWACGAIDIEGGVAVVMHGCSATDPVEEN